MIQYAEAIESKLTALRESEAARLRGFEDGHDHRRLFGNFERMALRRASCYYWTWAIYEAVLASSADLPDDTVVSLEKYHDMTWHWFWFERPVQVSPLQPFQGVLWGAMSERGEGSTRRDRRITIHLYGKEYGQLQVQDSLYLPDMWSLKRVAAESALPKRDALELGYARFDEPASMQDFLRFFVAMLLWIDQEILTTRNAELDRHARKRLLKVAPEQATDIKVVELRRRHQESHGEAHGDGVEWTCQWVVRGHWRQQYYPSTGERRPKWILPYVKGPEEMPLKVPRSEVFVVRR